MAVLETAQLFGRKMEQPLLESTALNSHGPSSDFIIGIAIQAHARR